MIKNRKKIKVKVAKREPEFISIPEKAQQFRYCIDIPMLGNDAGEVKIFDNFNKFIDALEELINGKSSDDNCRFTVSKIERKI